MTPEIGISAWSFHDALYAGRMTQFDLPEACSRLGFDRIEFNDLFWPPPPGSRVRYLPWRLRGWLARRDVWPEFQRQWLTSRRTRRHLATLCRQAGVRCVALTLNSDFTGELPARRRSAMSYVKAGLAVAQTLGAPVVRVTSDRRAQSDDLGPGAIERVIAGLQRAAVLARAAGIRLAVENHWGLTTEPEVMQHMVRAVDSPWLGVCLDLGNFAPERRLAGVEMLAPHAIHVHAKAKAFGADGEEVSIDYGASLAVLQRAGYSGPLVIEYEGDGDPVAGVLCARDLIRRYWAVDVV
jgi:sugar phosphate isomerase/epimerase